MRYATTRTPRAHPDVDLTELAIGEGLHQTQLFAGLRGSTIRPRRQASGRWGIRHTDADLLRNIFGAIREIRSQAADEDVARQRIERFVAESGDVIPLRLALRVR